ncbi:MAG: tetratricopeptide repeat protein [Acidobacteriota bacterium]|nr:tetratricopeptide repeat protein [Acidobacteriota bacterium]
MKQIFISLTAIFITASFVFGQTGSEKFSKQTGSSDKSETINKGNNNKLETLFIENSAILPRAVELNNQGIRLTLKKDYQNALELFKQADCLAPRNEQILFNLGTALLNLKRDSEAVAVFAKIIETVPTNANAYASLGLALNKVGKTADSFSAFRRSLEIAPNDPVTLCNYANALHQAGKDAEALAIVNQAIKLPAGDFSAAYNIRGTILFSLKKYGEAKTDFEAAARLDPANADPLNNLGVVFSREGNKKKALKYFLASERLAPDWEDVAYNLALNFSETGNREKSREYLLKLENSNPAIAEELKKDLLGKYVLDVSKIK